jgi:type II secretory pathway component PulF
MALVVACQGRHGERWRASVEKVLAAIPILNSARRNLALARLSIALEGLISAGVSIVAAWPMAAAASGSPELRRVVAAWRPGIDSGRTPAEMMRQSGKFPDLFANLYATAELSGDLDVTLRRLHTLYEEEGRRKLRAVAQWLPRLIYFVVMLGVAYYVIRFWTNYFSKLGEIGF